MINSTIKKEIEDVLCSAIAVFKKKYPSLIQVMTQLNPCVFGSTQWI